MKTYLLRCILFTVLNLLFSSVFLNAHTGTITGFTQYEAVDWLYDEPWREKPSQGKFIYEPRGSDSEKENALAKFEATSFWKILPDFLKSAIKENKENFICFDDKNCNFVDNSNVKIFRRGSSKYYVIPRKFGLMSFVGAPERTPALNPKNNKYYVEPTKNTVSKLSGENLVYVQKLTELLNRNIHFLGSSPIPRLDPKKMENGEYILCAIPTLTLTDPKDHIENVVERKKRGGGGTYQVFSFRRNLHKNRSTVEIMALLGLSDETEYEIASRVLTPLYHPETFAPENVIHQYVSHDCHGCPRVEHFLYRPIFLGWSSFTSSDPKRVKRALSALYQKYFWRLESQTQYARKRLLLELESIPSTDARYPAVKSVVKQADRIMERIEERAGEHSSQWAVLGGNREKLEKLMKKLPYSILDPEGTYLKRFLDKHKKLREAEEKQNKNSDNVSSVTFPSFAHVA